MAPNPVTPRALPAQMNVDKTVVSAKGSKFPIKGYAKPGFEPVVDAFCHNFAIDKELGSSCCTYHNGEIVVDLVGGWQDKAMTKPYTFDTIHVIHSSGKTVMGIVTLENISQGHFDFDDRVASIWPDFGSGGKGKVTVKELLEHSGGVAWLDPEYQPPAELTLTENLPLLARHIAGQPHNNGGKTTRAYHAITRGWYLNELMRRTRGISHGQRLIELGHELGIRVYCGLPKEADQFHCQVYDSDLRKLVNKLMPDLPGSPSWKSLHQSQPKPKNPSPTEDGINSNNFDILRGQSPSGFTVTNAHAMATLAGIMANRGTLREKRYISPQVWDRAHILETENADQKDLVIGLKFNYLHGGNVLSNEGTTWPQCIIDYTDPAKPKIARFPKLSKAEEFRWTGWFGLGGSHIQWNAEHNVSSGYAPNLLEPGVNGDARGKAICEATVQAVRALGGKSKM